MIQRRCVSDGAVLLYTVLAWYANLSVIIFDVCRVGIIRVCHVIWCGWVEFPYKGAPGSITPGLVPGLVHMYHLQYHPCSCNGTGRVLGHLWVAHMHSCTKANSMIGHLGSRKMRQCSRVRSHPLSPNSCNDCSYLQQPLLQFMMVILSHCSWSESLFSNQSSQWHQTYMICVLS